MTYLEKLSDRGVLARQTILEKRLQEDETELAQNWLEEQMIAVQKEMDIRWI